MPSRELSFPGIEGGFTKLDPIFSPLGRLHQRQAEDSFTTGRGNLLHLALERENGNISVFKARIGDAADPQTLFYAERIVKFFLWAAGGWRLFVNGPGKIVDDIRRIYAPGGARAFDVGFMEKIYEKPFQVVCPQKMPAAHESANILGGNLDGCRIGFDLGASQYKIAAVRDGKEVYSEAFPWNPQDQANPDYHFRHLNEGLSKAAAHLPWVDAIGGSSAGVIVDNRFMVSSLLRSVPQSRMPEARNLFLRLRDEWKVPFAVANDGEVTAMAGALALGVTGVLGISMGSSEAVGYINPAGKMTGWINELAFAPVDIQPHAAVDEWSGDRGVGALYFSQQAINKLLPSANILLPDKIGIPERVRILRTLVEKNVPGAEVYQTIGAYLGHTLPLYADFYEISHVLILGGITAGPGGPIMLQEARKVLRHDYPELAQRIRLHLPDEKVRRNGQAIAAASLPNTNS